MYGNNDEIQLPMDFQIADVNRLSAPEFRKLLDEIDHNAAGGQPFYFFSNHDQPRQWDRYGDGVHNDQIAKLMAALLLTTRATPLLYYGEEIGMRTTPPQRKEDVQDPIGKIGWPDEKGRDGERTPMQWDTSTNAGFSTADHTWLPVPPNSTEYNVAVEAHDPRSILSFYKRALALRRSEPTLKSGSYVPIDCNNSFVLSFLRKKPDGSDSVLVVLNMTGEQRTLRLDLTPYGIKQKTSKPLLTAPEIGGDEVSIENLTVPPYGVYIGTLH
jgi:alpha-glucosidase